MEVCMTYDSANIKWVTFIYKLILLTLILIVEL